MPKHPANKELLATTANEHGWMFDRLYGEPPLQATYWVLVHPSDWREIRLQFSGAGNVTRAWLETVDGQMAYIPYMGHKTEERNGQALCWLRMRSRDAWRDELRRGARAALDTLAVSPSSPQTAAAVLADVTAICGQLIAEVQRVVDGGGAFQTAQGDLWDPADEDAMVILEECGLLAMAVEPECASQVPGADPCDLGSPLGERLAQLLRDRRTDPRWP